MKKLTILILVLAMAFSVCACNKTDASEKGVPVASSPDYVEIINDLIAKYRDAYVEAPLSAEKNDVDLTFMEPEKMVPLSNKELETLEESYFDFRKYVYTEVYSSLDEMYPDAPMMVLGPPRYVNAAYPIQYKFLEADKCAGATEEELQEYLDYYIYTIAFDRSSWRQEPEKDFGDVVVAWRDISFVNSETGTAVEFSLYDGEELARGIFNSTTDDETYALLEEYLGKEFVDSLKAEADAAKKAALEK